MKLLCKLFGHKPELYGKDLVCVRCFKVFNSKIINRSDLDESSGNHEKWLDKHMD